MALSERATATTADGSAAVCSLACAASLFVLATTTQLNVIMKPYGY